MRDSLKNLPVYTKAEEIFQLTDALIKTFPAVDEFLQETTIKFLLEDAMIILAKISNAEAVELYDLKMENAAIIRKAARELYVNVGSLRFEEKVENKEYIELLRNEIDEFRLLFIDWVAGFDAWNYIIDSLGFIQSAWSLCT
ncbi:hypothetical protein [Flavobacterium sp.]|uniref:hypothetical protein n=1 Tax=Flavobacterium sp. TaxID=239 RepID=UPI0037C08CD7